MHKLIISSILAFPFTLGIFQFIPADIDKRIIFIGAMCIYWIFVGTSILLVINGRLRSLSSVFQAKLTNTNLLIKILPFLPAFGVLFISFLPNVIHISAFNFILIVLVSLVNGFIEEVYWRGLYLQKFADNFLIGFVVSSILFGAWHISLWYLDGITYHDGFLSLIGGALAMGFLWSYVSRKLKSIRLCIYAHILVNILAFTGLFVENQRYF
jgi:membrane protease YdiL (CAAX protease family)